MKESDIRDLSMVEEFFLKEKKWLELFAGKDGLIKEEFTATVPCPCCSGEKHHHVIRKNHFAFVECDECSTIFVNPRFTPEMIDQYYLTREERLNYQKILTSGDNQKNRISRIFKPRKKMIDSYLRANTASGGTRRLLDIGCASGQFLSTFKDKNAWTLYGVEASTDLAAEAKKLVKNAIIIDKPFEQTNLDNNAFDVVTLWEVLEHVYDPFAFMSRITKVLKRKGIVVVSVPNIEGFDIRILWDKGNAFSAPSHLNYYRRSSVHILFERAGLAVKDISTPGLLDVDIVKNRIGQDPDIINRLGVYWAEIFSRQDEATGIILGQLQKMISKNKLSSHMVIIAEKK